VKVEPKIRMLMQARIIDDFLFKKVGVLPVEYTKVHMNFK